MYVSEHWFIEINDLVRSLMLRYIYKIQILMVKAKQKATIKVDKTTSVNCKI